MCRVRPTFKKQAQQDNDPLSYLSNLEKRLKPGKLGDKGLLSALDKKKENSEKPVKLPLNMKLMVAEKPIAERAEAQEIAETLEEII